MFRVGKILDTRNWEYFDEGQEKIVFQHRTRPETLLFLYKYKNYDISNLLIRLNEKLLKFLKESVKSFEILEKSFFLIPVDVAETFLLANNSERLEHRRKQFSSYFPFTQKDSVVAFFTENVLQTFENKGVSQMVEFKPKFMTSRERSLICPYCVKNFPTVFCPIAFKSKTETLKNVKLFRIYKNKKSLCLERNKLRGLVDKIKKKPLIGEIKQLQQLSKIESHLQAFNCFVNSKNKKFSLEGIFETLFCEKDWQESLQKRKETHSEKTSFFCCVSPKNVISLLEHEIKRKPNSDCSLAVYLLSTIFRDVSLLTSLDCETIFVVDLEIKPFHKLVTNAKKYLESLKRLVKVALSN